MKFLGLLLITISIAIISASTILNPIVTTIAPIELDGNMNVTNITAPAAGKKMHCHCPCRWGHAHGMQNTYDYQRGCIDDGSFDTYVCRC